MQYNKYLYNKIIKNISQSIKRVLNEDTQNFDIVDYNEDDIIGNQEIADVISRITEEKLKYIKEFTESMMREEANPRYTIITKRFNIYNNYLYTNNDGDIKSKKNIFNSLYYWDDIGVGDILDPDHKYKNGISYFNTLSYEDKEKIMKNVNLVVNDYLFRGVDFSEDIKENKDIFNRLVFELAHLFTHHEYDTRIYVYLDKRNQEIVIKNIKYAYMNITSGLNQFYFQGYKILLPDGCNIQISDSASSAMNISKVKQSVLNVFSSKNKFGTIMLKYISVMGSDMAEDFLDKIYADKIEFINCKGFRYLEPVFPDKFKNPNTTLEVTAGSGKIKYNG